MMHEIEDSEAVTEDFVEFWATGQAVKGEFHCSDCGHGLAIVSSLPACPSCGGRSWERADWSPFTRSTATKL